MLALSPSFMLFLGPGRGGKGRIQAKFFWVVVPRDAIPPTPSWFGAGLRCCSGDFSSWEALICMGKDPTLHRYSFVNFLCDWAQNGCVNNSAGEDGRAKRWQLLCYEICINCIKHSVWTSAERPLLSVFIECRQSPGCRWQWASGWTPMLKHPELLLRCSRHGLQLPTQQCSAQGARSPALTPWGPLPPTLLPRRHRSWPDSQPARSYASHWAEGQGVETEAWQGLSLPVDPPMEKQLPSNKGRRLSLGFDDDVWKFEECFIRARNHGKRQEPSV